MACTKAVRAAALPWTQRRERRAAASTSVKYPTEKDRPRGDGLNLMASRGTWVSESPWAVMRVLGEQHCSANGYELRIKGGRKTGGHGDCVAFVPETFIGSGG